MCTIIQALNVAQAIAVTRTLPAGVSVHAGVGGVTLQGEFADPDALAHGLDLTRDESRDHVMEASAYVEACRFRSWHGVVQNIYVELVDVRPLADAEVTP